jgi:DNA-binding NarL/FixJ family response regulator
MSRLRMLFADANSDFQESVRQLVDAVGTEVSLIYASDGKEALTKAFSARPHLVLADFGLPRMEALDLVRQIKQRLPETRVIVMLSVNSKEYRLAAQEAGACATVSKPALNEDWMRMVLCLLQACRDAHQPPPDKLALLENLALEEYP